MFFLPEMAMRQSWQQKCQSSEKCKKNPIFNGNPGLIQYSYSIIYNLKDLY